MIKSLSKAEFIEPHFLPLGQIVQKNAERFPGTAALTMGKRETSWVELDIHCNRVANGLIAEGIQPGDRVAYLGKTTDAAFQILHGVAKARAVFTPVNWRLAPPEVAYILEDAQADLLFVSEEFLPMLGSLPAASKLRQNAIVLDAAVAHHPRRFENWRDQQDTHPPGYPLLDGDVVLQLYTSGTTGRPKGALITQEYVMNVGRMYSDFEEDVCDMYPGEEYLNFFPIFHTSGAISGHYLPFTRGCGLVIFSDFNPKQIFESLDQRSIPILPGVPTMLRAFLSDPQFREIDLSNVRYVMYGAAPMPIPLRDELANVVGCRFVQGYGATESLSISLLSPDDHESNSEQLKSVGRAMPRCEIKVVDPQGRELPSGKIGEVAVRSPAMAKGYWNLPDATAAAFKDGWYLTGDGGFLDENGYLFLKERIKDLIISGGENIYPGEVENVLYAHPSVSAAAVVAAPDEKWGEVPAAFIVIKDGFEFEPDALKGFLGERLARYKQPKYYQLIDALPLNASGKILKKDLREIARILPAKG